MKLVQSAVLAVAVLALSARAESEADIRAKAPARYTKFCAEYKAACVAVATEDKAKGNKEADVKYTCSKTFGKPSTKYRLACSANGVSYQEAALKRVGLGAASTLSVPTTTTFVTSTTTTAVETETATKYIDPLLVRRAEAQQGTDYIVARGAERRDLATFCAAYVKSCKAACHAAGSKSRVRTCAARNELKGQYTLDCRCANKNIRTQTALINMAKEMNLVEVPGPTMTATSTAVSVETTTVATVTVEVQRQPPNNNDYCTDGKCDCEWVNDSSFDVKCKWGLTGNGQGGMLSSYKTPCDGSMTVHMIGGAGGPSNYQGYFAAGTDLTRTFEGVKKDTAYIVQIGGSGKSTRYDQAVDGGWPNGGAGTPNTDTAGGGGSTELQQDTGAESPARIMVAGGGGGNAGARTDDDADAWYGKVQDGQHTTQTQVGGAGSNAGGGGGGGILGGLGGDGLGGYAGSSSPEGTVGPRPGFTLGQMDITYSCSA